MSFGFVFFGRLDLWYWELSRNGSSASVVGAVMEAS